MNRSDKIELVDRMKQHFAANPNVVLATFSGLSVNQATDLRAKVREAGGSFSVIKNRLAKLAAPGTPMEHLSDRFTGPCAIALHDSDPVVLAKTLSEFSKENPQVQVLAGVVDGRETVDAAGVKQLAALPGLPELRAQLLALVQTPASQLARLLQTPGAQLARVMDARRLEQEGGS